jgi:hypothetical protein
MAEFVYLNVNPDKKTISDCVTRAIHLATNIPYPEVRRKLFHTAKLHNCSKLCVMCYKFLIEDVLKCKRVNCDGMYPADFADLHKQGKYLLRMNGHICCLIDGKIFDIFDSRYMDFLTDAWEYKG